MRLSGHTLDQGRFRYQRGITGLGTAIVLIAFVVVSSVFAFAALSTGLFSADKSKEVHQAGLSEVSGTTKVRGSVQARATLTTKSLTTVSAEAVGTGDGVGKAFTLDNSHVLTNSETVYVAAAAKTRGTDYTIDNIVFTIFNAAGGRPVDLTSGQPIITYMDVDSLAGNTSDYILTRLGNADADNLLEANEFFQIKIDASTYGLTNNDQFTIELAPASGAVVVTNRTIPAYIDARMDLG